jgi:hypothetical protein
VHTPPDKYRFREVLTNVAMMPSMLAWLVVGLVLTRSLTISVIVGIVIGLPFAWFVGWAVYMLGHGLMLLFDRLFGQHSR